MSGALLVGLAAFETFAFLTGRPTLTRQRGIARGLVFAAWAGLGAHLAYEAIADQIGNAAQRSFGSYEGENAIVDAFRRYRWVQ